MRRPPSKSVVVGGGTLRLNPPLPIISLPVCVGGVCELVYMYAYMLYVRVITFPRFCRSLLSTPVYFCLSSRTSQLIGSL